MDQRSKIAILGFGAEGKAMMKWLKKHEYNELTICDRNVDLREDLPQGVSTRLGEDYYLKDLTDFDVIFRTPGISYLTHEVQSAKARDVEVTSCSGFFVDQCPCQLVGVSGTKGKGTTSTLIYEMLKVSGRDVYLGGNIGEPPIKFLDKLKGDSVVVLEMSSFQLQDMKKSPHYSVLLNTTSDHLDYHADRGEYLAAKESLLAHQDEKGVAVLNDDYEYVDYYLPLVKGRKRLVSVRKKVKDGAYVDGGVIYYSCDGKAEKILPVADVALIGSHNLENILPAVVVAKEMGVSAKDIAKIVREFKGLPHRLEFVREVAGVRYYNDSFSTTPETSMAAVDSFDEPLALIAGGYDKGAEYDEWALKILTKPNLGLVVLIGATTDKMEKSLIEAEEKLGSVGEGGAEGSPTKILRRPDLEEAVLTAYKEIGDGGVVVMSPAAASFDMFKDYKQRGEIFRKVVGELR